MTFAKRLLCAMFVLAAFPVAAFADCTLHAHDKVVLYGRSDDPEVFVWDSRFRLRAYSGGSFDQAQALLPHAFLAHPGTRALVAACIPGFVLSKYGDAPEDAIGIIIVGGDDRGRAGWVLMEDVRRAPAHDSAPAQNR